MGSREYHKRTNDRSGRPPTLRQFAGFAHGPANHWFGGDLSALYEAFGEAPPLSPERSHLIPRDAAAFVRDLYIALGGTDEPSDAAIPFDEYETWRRRTEENDHRARLANLALEYLRLEEALGSKPVPKELGSAKFERHSKVISNDPEEAWAAYARTIEKVLREASGWSPRHLSTETGVDP